MSDPAVIGALAGLSIGMIDFVVLGFVRSKMADRSDGAGATAAIEAARYSQLALFPLVGWFVGPTLMG